MIETILESIGIVLLIGVGIWLGRVFSGFKKSYWILGFLVPLSLILLITVTLRFHRFIFTPPFSWLVAGRREYVIFAVAVAMMLMTPLSRLRQKRVRILVMIIMVLGATRHAVLPILWPVFLHHQLSQLVTVFSPDGVCLQQTQYTCGPASGVTALAQLGINADEGRIAIRAHSSPVAGTPVDMLSETLQNLYGSEGIICTVRLFDSINQLKTAVPTIAVIKFTFWIDHYVTVLEVADDKVIVGDPLQGKVDFSYGEFSGIWRFSGIVISRSGR